jgi:hypothetical protein
MENFLKKIFTGKNYEAGLLITISLVTIMIALSVMGWKLLLLPIAFIGVALIGFVTNYIMNKLNNK